LTFFVVYCILVGHIICPANDVFKAVGDIMSSNK